MLLVLLLLLTGCADGPAQGINVCGPWQPILVTETELSMLSDETVRQIVAHNEVGERLCNWRAPS